MAQDNSFDDYSIEYLIANKDTTSDYFQLIKNACVSLLDGHKLSESESDFFWELFSTFVVVAATYLKAKTWERVYKTFYDIFSQYGETLEEFMFWLLSDLILPTMDVDWASVSKIPIELPPTKKSKSKKRSKKIELFYRDYVEKGERYFPTPSEQDLRAFAKVALKIIEKTDTKEALQKISFGRFQDWFPDEVRKAIDSIGKLPLRDGRLLVAAKPFVELASKGIAHMQVADDNEDETNGYYLEKVYSIPAEYESRFKKALFQRLPNAIRLPNSIEVLDGVLEGTSFLFTALPECLNVQCECFSESSEGTFILICDWIERWSQTESSPPIEPPKPPEPKKAGGKINLWLDWYHAMRENGYKCTLEDVASKSGYSLGYIKQKHMIYKAKPNPKT